MIAVNLYGEKIDRMTYEITFERNDSYFKAVCDKILEFKNSLGAEDGQILGIGFAMQGLVSPDSPSRSFPGISHTHAPLSMTQTVQPFQNYGSHLNLQMHFIFH